MRRLVIAGLAGSILWLLSLLLTFPGTLLSAGNFGLSLAVLWYPLMAAGWLGLHHSQARRWEPLSLIGSLILCLSFLLFTPLPLGLLTHGASDFPLPVSPEKMKAIQELLAFPGYLLFSIAILKHQHYPPWSAYLLMAVILAGLINSARPEQGWSPGFTEALLPILFLFLGKYALRKRGLTSLGKSG